MRAIQLQTEYMDNPCGIDIRNPRLTWLCQGGKRQTAYEIQTWLLKDGEQETLWNSGKVASSRMNAFYDMELQSRQRIGWQVRLWDDEDQAGDWSEMAWFEAGLLSSADFQADWINPELSRDNECHQPASYLRKGFFMESDWKRGRLYITCHGLYEAWLNGERVGDFVLAPGVSTYDKRLAYQTYDVTDLLKPGENELLVLLGDGWYRSCSGVDGGRNLYGEDIALLCQLEADGVPVCLSDESWEATQEGPLRENDMQQGEVYDAGREELSGWHPVKCEAYGYENLICSNSVPIKEQERFHGHVFITPNGARVIDYGQNLAGYIEFTLEAHAGDVITLTHGESLDEHGNFTNENFQDRKRHLEGEIRQQVIYTCKEGWNHYKSRFTIWGFRYAKVETTLDLSQAEFTSIAIYSEMEQVGSFTCSDPAVNQLVKNSLWSMKSNFCDVPTDCPTRERAAWTGDMGVFAGTGLYLADCYPIIRKWLAECRENQFPDGRIANIAPPNNVPSFFAKLLAGSVGWGDACIIVPWELYKRSGDERILAENYEMMKGWYQHLESRAKEQGEASSQDQASGQNFDPSSLPPEYQEKVKQALAAGMSLQTLQEMAAKSGMPQPTAQSQENPYADYTIDTGVDYGEWCEPDVESTSVMGKPQSQVATAYFAQSGRMLTRIARILGKEEDAAHFDQVAERAAKAYHHIATENGRIHSDRQADYVRAISFHLLPPTEAKEAAADLNRNVQEHGYHLNTGFLSTPSLCSVLTRYGYTETAYRLLLQDTMPGWLYAVGRGATTIWENWDGINEKGEVKASLNHYSYGAICGWLFAEVCGIHVEGENITLSPHPHPLLNHAKAIYRSPLGEIHSSWHYEGEKLHYQCTIPSNTTATLELPNGTTKLLEPGAYHISWNTVQ